MVQGLSPTQPSRPTDTNPSPSSAASTSAPTTPHTLEGTPRKMLRDAIISVISPPPSASTEEAKAQKRKKRARVQGTQGEVLSSSEVLKRLQKEAENREQKKKQPKKSEKSTKKNKVKDISFSDSDIEEISSSSDSEGGVNINDLVEGESFVIVDYEGQYFPGKVEKITKTGVKVSCFVKSLNAWKWPQHPDVHTYPLEDIIRIISHPTPCGSRGQYSIPEVKQYWRA